MNNEQKEARIKTLMKTAIKTMDDLNKLSPDHWRLLVIAFYKDASLDAAEKLAKLRHNDNQGETKAMSLSDGLEDSLPLQERLLTCVCDAIVDTTLGGKPYDPIAVRNWFGHPKEIREILKEMPEDVFNAAFGKLAQEVISQNGG